MAILILDNTAGLIYDYDVMKKIMLVRLQPKFITLVNTYKKSHNVNQKGVANLVDMDQSHLSNLMKYKRKLSANYIWPFLMKGVFRMSDIYDGKPESNREKNFWVGAKFFENRYVLEKIGEAKENGLTDEILVAYLEGWIQSHNP